MDADLKELLRLAALDLKRQEKKAMKNFIEKRKILRFFS